MLNICSTSPLSSKLILALGLFSSLSFVQAQTSAQMSTQAAQKNQTLTQNQNVAKAQGMQAASKMLQSGGFNFGAGQMDYQGLQNQAGLTTGMGSQSFGAPDGAGNLSFQTGPLMVSCLAKNQGFLKK